MVLWACDTVPLTSWTRMVLDLVYEVRQSRLAGAKPPMVWLCKQLDVFTLLTTSQLLVRFCQGDGKHWNMRLPLSIDKGRGLIEPWSYDFQVTKRPGQLETLNIQFLQSNKADHQALTNGPKSDSQKQIELLTANLANHAPWIPGRSNERYKATFTP